MGLAWCGTPVASAEVDSRPNIVIVLADDMGYSDLGCTGAEIETPHLDQLAADGVLFSHAYTTSRCCPTRASLLTGQYQWDVGLGHMNTTVSPYPEYGTALNHRGATIAELLGSSGYQTFMSGKWHLGDARENWPDHRGFDAFFGSPMGGGLYFYPSAFYDRPLFANGEEVTPEPGWYSTDGFTDAAIGFLQEQRDPDRPFFLYLAYIAPHFPLQAHAEDIAKYEGVYEPGHQAIRDARYSRQKELGLVPEHSTLPESEFGEWDEYSDSAFEAQKMAVYAAQMDRMDQNIGRLMQALRDVGVWENTVLLFLSDNGAARADFNRTPEARLGAANSNAAYGKWYNVSNTPYRMSKAQEHEGGIITPLIMHWPAGTSMKPGRIDATPVHVMDILPTCLELARMDYPSHHGSHELDDLDGRSFLSHWTRPHPASPRDLYWEHEGNRAARSGDWKLVSLHNRPWELYDLSRDPFEQRNLVSEHPEKAARLKASYKAWANKHGVQPWPLPRP